MPVIFPQFEEDSHHRADVIKMIPLPTDRLLCGPFAIIYNVKRYLIGIDEAGRGPLAGPVAVGAVIVPSDFDWSLVIGAKDSKQMTPKAREEIYAKLCDLRRDGKLDFTVTFSSASMIDMRGIVLSIQSALDAALSKITEVGPLQKRWITTDVRPLYGDIRVVLDGGLRAPMRFTDQETIIRGDQSEPVISLASIAAKVLRDRHMTRLARKHPAYGFEAHKGYGTLAHRRAIKQAGLCSLHRATFCTRIIYSGFSRSKRVAEARPLRVAT